MNPIHLSKDKTKKCLALVLVLLLLPLVSLTAFGQTDAGDITTADTPDDHDGYGHYSGTVMDIIPLVSQNDAYHVVIETQDINTENDETSPVWFTVTDATIFFSGDRPEAGDTITGFYDLQAPMLMIYPPQYHAVAMAVNPGDTHYFVGHFDDDLVDADNRLMLVIVEDTLVQLADGSPYEGSLKNQLLAVVYGASTRSIPAQTRPEKVILLPAPETDTDEIENSEIENSENEDEAENTAQDRTPLRTEDWMPPIETAPIVVENQVLTDAPAAFATDDRVIMVPLKHIAEALGYNVTWSAELRVAMLSDSFTVAIGQDSYVDMSKDEPISLGTAPVIRENRTFVPLHFFRDVIPMNNVYYFEHQIDINNQEKMH